MAMGWRWSGHPTGAATAEGERQVMAAVDVIYHSVLAAHANT